MAAFQRTTVVALSILAAVVAFDAGATCAPRYRPCGGPPTTGTLGSECVSGDGRAFDLRSFHAGAGEVVTADVSADFDGYLGLVAPPGRIVRQASGRRAVVALEIGASGGHDIIVSSAAAGAVGNYSLSLTCFASEGAEVMLGRFAVEVWWRDADGTGRASAGQALSGDSGWWSHGNPGTAEVMVKVLDGCAVNGYAWVFAAGLTDVHTALRVRDGATGRSWVYSSPQGEAFRAVQDTTAIPCG